MLIATIFSVINLLLCIAIITGLLYLFTFIVKALKTYIRSAPARKERAAVKKTLGEVLKELRTRNHMTQEFVAEHLGYPGRLSANGKTAIPTPVHPICWHWRSSMVCHPRNWCSKSIYDT